MKILVICGICILSELLAPAMCLNILGLFPYPGKSHMDVILPLMEELAMRGHNVTVLSHYPKEKPIQGYKDLSLRGSMPLLLEVHRTNHYSMLYSRIMFMYLGFTRMFGSADISCRTAFKSKAMENLMKSDEKFDVIIAEMFNSDCLIPINEKFKAPVIGFSTAVLLPWIGDKFDATNNPSYIPSLFLEHSTKMSFLERVENTVVHLVQNYMFTYIRCRKDDEIVRENLGTDTKSVSIHGKNASLLLINTHHSLNFARPFPPGVVEIGGIHIKQAKRLPKNIEKFINESTHGVIYFSLGSMIKGHTFPQEKREEFLKAFARLPQRVLWKWENETMPGKPDNVMIQKWMPQFDILSHPNVKAFISHGGLLGTTEAVHCGVPMLVMPQYGDQHTNAKAVEANGGGVILYLKDATEEKVYQSLKTILDPEFKAKAQALSERFRDRPMSPMDTAIYWIEYVARHKGAPHLRTAAVDMPLYQYLLLDVLAFLLAIILTFVYVTYKILSLILRKMFSKKKMKQS